MLKKKRKAKELKAAGDVSRKKRGRSMLALRMESVGLEPKKEIAAIVLLDLLLAVMAVVAYFRTRMIAVCFALALIALIIDYFLLTRYKRIKKATSAKMEEEFVHIFSYFEIFIHNGRPVYNALEDCVKYASEGMHGSLLTLLSAIDEDKSIKPYLAFAADFDSVEIRQVMINIYKMSIEGNSLAYLRQFETVFAGLAAEKRKSAIERHQEKLNNLNFVPLVDSALSMGMITVAIVAIMGSLSSYGF